MVPILRTIPGTEPPFLWKTARPIGGDPVAITVAEMQTALGETSGRDPQVVRYFGAVSTFQEWLIVGGPVAPGRARMVRTTAASDAATQAAEVVTALAA